jgi:hypothetical protein
MALGLETEIMAEAGHMKTVNKFQIFGMHFDKQIYKWLEIETRKRDDEECLAR